MHVPPRVIRPQGALTEWVAKATLPTRHGDFDTHVFRSARSPERDEHVDGLCRRSTSRSSSATSTPGRDDVLVRVHSECMTSEVFGSLKCDCKEQLDAAMAAVARAGAGADPLPPARGARHRPRQQDPRVRPAVARARHGRRQPPARPARRRAPLRRRARHAGAPRRGERPAADEQPRQGDAPCASSASTSSAVCPSWSRQPSTRRATSRPSASGWSTTCRAGRAPGRQRRRRVAAREATRDRRAGSKTSDSRPALYIIGASGRMRIALTHNLRVDRLRGRSRVRLARDHRRDRAGARARRAPRRALRRDGARLAARHAARGVRARPRVQPGRGPPRQDATRLLPGALRGARHPVDRQRRVHALRHARQGAHEEAARRLGRAQPARAPRHARHAAERRPRRAAVPGHREAELRGLEQGHRAGQRRRGPDRARPRARRAAREVPRRRARRALRPGHRRARRARRGAGRRCRPSRRSSTRRTRAVTTSSTTASPTSTRACVERRAPARSPGRARASACDDLAEPHALGVRAARRRRARLPRRRRRRGVLPERHGHPELRATTARSSPRPARSASTTTRRCSPSCASAAVRHGLLPLLDATQAAPGARPSHEPARRASPST